MKNLYWLYFLHKDICASKVHRVRPQTDAQYSSEANLKQKAYIHNFGLCTTENMLNVFHTDILYAPNNKQWVLVLFLLWILQKN